MVERRSPKPSMRVQLLLPLPVANKKPKAAFFLTQFVENTQETGFDVGGQEGQLRVVH